MAGMWIKRSSWSSIKNMWIRTTVGWSPVRSGWIRVNSSGTGWKRFWFKANLPNETTKPRFNTTNTGSGTIYDGPTATSPQYLNADLFGKDGTYSNYTAITGRKISYGDTATADINSRTTLVNDDRFTSAGGVTTSDRLSVDEKYLFYEMTVENGTDPLNQINSISNGIKMIKSYPALIDCGWTESEEVGTQLGFDYSIENYYYNRIEPSSSYIRWWRSSSTNPGGTLIKQETITDTTTGTPSSTSRTGTSYYTPTSSDIGYYIVAEIIAVSSYTRHEGYTDNFSLASFPTDGVIGSALTFSNVAVKDYYDKNGLDNRGNWPTGTLNQYTGQLSGYDSNTVLRIRYRVYNYNTGLYWKPSTGTQTTASSAWDSWTSDGSGNGYISNVSVSGGVATFYDYFDLSSDFFNGGGGTPATWWLEVELSAVRGGPRVYYIDPYETFYISKRIDPTVSVSPSTVATNSDVTISGSFVGFPATPSTNAYPRQYIVYYGDGNNSGYLPSGEWANGTLNPTYSLTKSYSSTGTYTVTVRPVPYGEDATATVTVANVVSQISAPTARATNTFSTSTVKYLDSITWASGTYSNASSVSSVLLYSTNTSNIQSPGGNTSTSFRTTNPYTLSTVDPSPPAYIFAVRDTVVGTNGITYYFYSNQITSALADGVSFSYGTATSTSGGWTASINSGSQSGASYSYVSATAGSGSVNSSTGAVTASGLGSNQFSTITVSKSVSGYNTATSTASGQSGVVATVPTAPTSLFTSNISSSGATINWSPPTSNGGAAITSYEVNRDGFGFFNVGNVTQYFYTLSQGTYTIGVRAVNSVGSGSAATVSVTIPAPPAPTTPAITSGPFISWGSGNNFTLSATASNATNIEFQVQYANTNGGTVQNTVTYFMGASAGSRTTGSQSYPWARTRARANNTSTGLSSSFTAYTGWA
jgi:hypothetical protein